MRKKRLIRLLITIEKCIIYEDRWRYVIFPATMELIK